MAKLERELWEVQGIELPVNIYYESRYNNRISITKKGVNLRIPQLSTRQSEHSHRQWAYDWLCKQVQNRPDLLSRFKPSQYFTGHVIKTPARNYELEMRHEDRKTSTAKLNNSKILITLNGRLKGHEKLTTTRSLISRVMASDQYERVAARIHDINNYHFKKEIRRIRLKNNSSNWGSCSGSGNINISTRTLLAPFEVQDYIFVHELAHRIEMNHSEKYWSIVANVLPNYKIFENWIKKYGSSCQF